MTASDLSPGSLAQLEAKLVADLAMVRRVRALLEEHQGLGSQGASTAAEALTAPAQVMEPPAPQKSESERLNEALEALPAGETFGTKDVRRALSKQGWQPKESRMRLIMNKLLRTGAIAVVTAGIGRGGSSYRRRLSAPAPEGSTLAPQDSAPSPAVSGQESSV